MDLGGINCVMTIPTLKQSSRLHNLELEISSPTSSGMSLTTTVVDVENMPHDTSGCLFRLNINSRDVMQDELMPGGVLDRIARVPSTRYFGSKRRILPWLYGMLQDIPFDTVLDCFGGTASVSLLFKAMGKNVTYLDALQSNTVIAQAVLAKPDIVPSPSEACKFFDSINPTHGLIYNEFSGLYYTDKENAWLDGAISAIRAIPNNSGRNAYMYSLFQACLKKRPFNLFHRANLSLRLNDEVKRNFGNATTWNRDFAESAASSYCELHAALWDSGTGISVLDAGDALTAPTGYDLVYLDPPYIRVNGRSNDYLKMYHFLEGLVEYDSWRDKIDYATRCRAYHSRLSSNLWHRRETFLCLLREFLKLHRDSTVVMSYAKGGYPDLDAIINEFNHVFENTRVETKDVSQPLSRNLRTEVLVIGTR